MLINVFTYLNLNLLMYFTFLSYHLLYLDGDDNNEKLSLHLCLDFHIELIIAEKPQT
jgi:hypothetical protein